MHRLTLGNVSLNVVTLLPVGFSPLVRIVYVRIGVATGRAGTLGSDNYRLGPLIVLIVANDLKDSVLKLRLIVASALTCSVKEDDEGTLVGGLVKILRLVETIVKLISVVVVNLLLKAGLGTDDYISRGDVFSSLRVGKERAALTRIVEFVTVNGIFSSCGCHLIKHVLVVGICGRILGRRIDYCHDLLNNAAGGSHKQSADE